MYDSKLINPHYRVVGLGQEMMPVIAELNRLNNEYLSCTMIDGSGDLTPSGEDKMIVFLTDGESQQLVKLTKCFHEAGVLTLVVSTRRFVRSEYIDAMTVTPIGDMSKVVRGLLDPILLNGPTNVAFHDIHSILHDACYFRITATSSHLKDNRISDALDKQKQELGEEILNEVDGMMLVIYTNENLEPKLMMNELQPLMDHLNRIPENTGVIWGLHYDNNMSTDEVRISTIMSAKNPGF